MPWLFPRKGNLHITARLVIGLVGNVAMLVYVLPRRERLFDTRDYRYVPLDLSWAFFLAAIPLFIVIAVFPVLWSGRAIHRWLAIALSVLPAFLALAEWFQLLTF
jgi:hypothetical protein